MPPSLVCKQCGHENEPQRIYCHQCGAKLDRSVLPPEPDRQTTLAQQKRRVRKLTQPRTGFFADGWRSLVGSLAWAALVAATIQMARPPEDVPPMPGKDQILEAPRVPMQIEDALFATVPQQVVLKEEAINLYLANAIRQKPMGLMGDEVRFERAYVKLDEGGLRVFMQHALFQYPIYVGTAWHLSVANGRLQAENRGGWVGRLPIHPVLSKYSWLVFEKLWAALKRERELLDKVRAIEVRKGLFLVRTGAAA